MKAWMFLIFLGMQEAAAVTHSMTYIVTAATGLHEFPEHNEVGLVDGQEFVHYDSKLMKVIPKTDWIEKNVGADYWERETQRNINTQETFKANIAIVMKRFNQTDGAHIVQQMYSCEWDDETGEVKGYMQFGYDGEDFINFDLKEQTWVAPVQQAHITKHKWDSNRALIAQTKNYLTQECPEWVKKYVNYGRSSLMRTERPSVSVLQKSSSSPVSCHATGFYPNRAEMVWKKDGVELHEGVSKGEILTNNDGTFQMSVDLDVSSVEPEDWHRYRCVFQLSGVNEDIITRLVKADIKTNEVDIGNVPPGNNLTIIIAVVAVVLVLGAVIGIIVYKKKTSKCSQPPMKDPAVKEPLNPPPTV